MNDMRTNRKVLTVAASGLVTMFAAAAAQAAVHVVRNGSMAADGTAANPYGLVASGACALPAGDTLRIGPGSYAETVTINKPARLEANGGTVRIGQAGAAETTLKVVTFNTHLFGDAIPNLPPPFPAIPLGLVWQDEARADRIGDAINAENADVAGLQEVWDPDLASRIISHSGMLYSSYADQVQQEGWQPPAGPPLEVPGVLNSGLLMLSVHPVDNPQQVFYNDEAEFFETLASKSYQITTIYKDGFEIGFVNTHMQAFYEPEQVEARAAQIQQLSAAIAGYRQSHPARPVIAIGDFNVVGESGEYGQTMAPLFSGGPDMMDLARNFPCAAPGPQHLTALHDNDLNVFFTSCSEPGYSTCLTACAPVGQTCGALCGASQDACLGGCWAVQQGCIGGCDTACVTENIIVECLLAIPSCTGECCGFTGCDWGCYEDCFAGCGAFDECVADCESSCQGTYNSCASGCKLACDDCLACEQSCEESYCATPDASEDSRLDYILFTGSLDGTVDLVPSAYELRPYQGPNPLSGGGLSTTELSDHIGVMGQFRVVRRP